MYGVTPEQGHSNDSTSRSKLNPYKFNKHRCRYDMRQFLPRDAYA